MVDGGQAPGVAAADAALCHPNSVQIGRHSNCPSNAWQDAIAPHLAALEPSPLVFVNVGANKGFNLLEFADRFGQTNITSRRWHEFITREAKPKCKAQCCGVCFACNRPSRPSRLPRAPPTRVTMHAFELQPANVALLRQTIDWSGLPVTIHDAAVSNASGTLYTHNSPPGKAIARRALTLDDFISSAQIPRVHMLSVDTEGWDGLVLHGAASTLAAHRVEVVEFEYSRGWRTQMGDQNAMRAVLAWLHELGYSCFWQGNRGELAGANGPCWNETFLPQIAHRWTNLVCAHRPDIVARLSMVRRDAVTGRWPASQRG